MNRRALYPLSTWLLWVVALPLALIAIGFATVVTSDAESLLFDGANLWWLGGAGPAAGLIILYGVLRRRRALQRFASAELAPLLARRISPLRQAVRAGLVVAAILMVVAGLIGPRWGIYLEKQKVYGVDIVVALDVSRSMLAEDVQPNRLERAKREIRQQLTERAVFQHTNRLALLAFAGSTSLRLPLTTDHLAFRSKLELTNVGAAPRGGTAISQAIRSAIDLFAKSPEQATKIILLFTDGEDHEGGPAEAAREAFEEHNIRTFTIGLGDPARTVGVQVPAGAGDGRKPLLYDGQIVFSKLDVTGLRQIAEAGGGRFAPIRDLHSLVDAIAGMRRTELSSEERVRHKPQYQWFLAAALILLGLESLISERRASIENLPQRTWQQGASG
jgi:Ca-activated chloride channel family protein